MHEEEKHIIGMLGQEQKDIFEEHRTRRACGGYTGGSQRG